MKFKILLVFALLPLILGTASAVYELCDSVERDNNGGFFRCNITTTKYRFEQQDIDNFWETIKEDVNYQQGRMTVVEWKIKKTVLEIADNLRFVQLADMNLTWDLILVGDANTIHDINTSLWTGTPRPTNHTAIKKKMGAMQEYLISFAPLGERKTIRNLELQKPEGALAVYISGSHIKKMQIDIEGNLTLSGAYIENIASLKAKNIYLSNKGYILNSDLIEAENISMESMSSIRRLGGFEKTAISLKNGSTGISMKDNSSIEDIIGGIEVEADITMENGCKIENISYVPSDVIQWIHARSIDMKEDSEIRGMGGKPGEIVLTDAMSLNDSSIMGKQNYKPATITAKSITLSNNSSVVNFDKGINVTGRETFSIKSGGNLREFGGTINSCASLMMDGNTVKIFFTEDSEKIVKAKGLILDNNAEIVCPGEEDCNYTFVRQSCDVAPQATLNVKGNAAGTKPLTVEFTGLCDGNGTPVTCTISFGDDNSQQPFDGNATHTYEEIGNFTAVLTATNAYEQTATNEKSIVVRETGIQPQPALQASLSKQIIKKGEEITLNIDCEAEFQSFNVENDLGLPPITTVPESCPATLGPFTIPEDATSGIHSFRISGTAADGTAFEQTVSVSVEEEAALIPGLPTNLEEILMYAGPVLVLIIIAALVILILKRKAGAQKKPEPKAKKEKQAEEEPKKEGLPAAPEAEKPPWIMESPIMPGPAKPVEKPAPKEEKPAQAKAEEKQAVQPKEQKPAQAEIMPPAKATLVEKPLPEPGEKPTPADKFRELAEMLKRSKEIEGLPEKKLAAALGEKPATAPEEKPIEERQPATAPEEKPTALAPKETPTTAPEEKPIEERPPAIAPEEKPAAERPPVTAPEEKPIEEKPLAGPEKKRPEEKRPVAEEKAPALPKETAAKAEEKEAAAAKPEKPAKRRFPWFRRKKKPAEKPEEKAEERELPPWLRKIDEEE